MPLRFLLLFIAGKLKKQTAVYRIVLRDSRTPSIAKVLLGAAVFYLMLPFDFIPDFIPFLGQLDDAVILPILIGLAFVIVPQEVWRDARSNLPDNKLKQLS